MMLRCIAAELWNPSLSNESGSVSSQQVAIMISIWHWPPCNAHTCMRLKRLHWGRKKAKRRNEPITRLSGERMLMVIERGSRLFPLPLPIPHFPLFFPTPSRLPTCGAAFIFNHAQGHPKSTFPIAFCAAGCVGMMFPRNALLLSIVSSQKSKIARL